MNLHRVRTACAPRAVGMCAFLEKIWLTFGIHCFLKILLSGSKLVACLPATLRKPTPAETRISISCPNPSTCRHLPKLGLPGITLNSPELTDCRWGVVPGFPEEQTGQMMGRTTSDKVKYAVLYHTGQLPPLLQARGHTEIDGPLHHLKLIPSGTVCRRPH